MKFFKIKSYAKINLSLNIVGKKQSKLHRIESLVSFIGLHDLIYIRSISTKKNKIYFQGKFSKGISKNNTVSKLLQLMERKNILEDKKYEIKIIKNIPKKSGMGGGSMNAASLINYFVKKKILELNKETLIKLSNSISSDVVLGIDPKNIILSSNGRVTKFKNKLDYHILVVKPNFGCSTKLIYAKVKNFSKAQYNIPSKNLFKTKNIINSNNDLEKIAFKKYPILKKLQLFLSNLPNIVFVRMSGSGSSIVAYFHSKRATDIAANQFRRKFKKYWYITSKTI